MTTTASGDTPREAIRIEGEMTIYRAAELKPVLLAPLNDNSPVAVDLSGVAEIDSAGIQLLMLMKKTALERGGMLSFTGHSPAVIEAIELLNLAGFFGDPIVLAPHD